MKKVLLTVMVAAFGAMLIATPAIAEVFTLDQSQLHGLYELFEDPETTFADLLSVSYAGSGVKYVGNVGDDAITTPDFALMGIGAKGSGLDTLGIDLAGYDSYALTIKNVNENPWEYALYGELGSYSFATNLTTIGVGETKTLTLDFANAYVWNTATEDYDDRVLMDLASLGVSWDELNSLGFVIGADVPLGANLDDYTFETIVYPVPEPASLSLLGFSLIGLAGLRRKKRS